MVKQSRLIHLTPTVVAAREPDGTVTVMEFDKPRNGTDVYGYLVRYSYKTPAGEKVHGVFDKDYISD